MSSNVRAFPQIMPPRPANQGWVWNGSGWVWDCDDQCPPDCPPFPAPPPFPCPPSGFPTPCPPWFPPPPAQAPWYPGANGGVSFSATAPVNPIRGNFWWDGVMLHLFDGAAWVNIGPGASGSSGSGGGAGSGAVVGTSPPVNPAAGVLWWNGTILQVWDGTAWQLSGGAIVNASPPPGPVKGELWWNGSALQVWDGTSWHNVVTTATATAMELAITQPTAVTVGTPSGWAPVPFTTTPLVDVQGGYSASNFRYTPKVAGFYQFQCRALIATAGGIAIVKNDPGTFSSLSTDTTVTIGTLNLTGASSGWLSAAGIAQMNGTTDYIRLWAWEQAGSFLGAGSNNVLSAFLLP